MEERAASTPVAGIEAAHRLIILGFLIAIVFSEGAGIVFFQALTDHDALLWVQIPLPHARAPPNGAMTVVGLAEKSDPPADAPCLDLAAQVASS